MALASSPAGAAGIRDAEIEAKLEAFLEPLLNKANISSQIKVRLILNSSYNAFVTSDNIIYLHSGLLLKAESLEEVIGVMAHELGHIVSGHVARKNESLEVARNASSLSTALAAAAALASILLLSHLLRLRFVLLVRGTTAGS